MYDEALATEVLAEGAHDTEEAGIARGQDADALAIIGAACDGLEEGGKWTSQLNVLDRHLVTSRDDGQLPFRADDHSCGVDGILGALAE
jgi:hypothetical protein